MPTHVALIRGVNVGGHNKIVMAELRQIVSALGVTDVATYIQSGNVVFTSGEAGTGAVAAELEERLAESLNTRPAVVVLSRAELKEVVADNPFPDETNPKCVHAVFRSEPMGTKDRADVTDALQRSREKGSGDEVHILGRTLYLHTPNGMGRSELGPRLTRFGTTRNWATVTKLLAMLDA